jgi:hypothetical protein
VVAVSFLYFSIKHQHPPLARRADRGEYVS